MQLDLCVNVDIKFQCVYVFCLFLRVSMTLYCVLQEILMGYSMLVGSF